MVELLPGVPFRDEEALAPAVRERLDALYGRDADVGTRYLRFLGNALTLRAGPSLLQEAAAPDFLAARARNSFGFGFAAFAIATTASLLIGFLVAGRPRAKKFYWRASQLLVALPTMVLVPALILVFALGLGWFPVARLDEPGAWVLPLAALALRPSLAFSRVFVLQIQQVETLEFVRVHRALGFSELQTFLKATMKNALIPLLAAMPSVLSSLLSGSIVVETMFAIPGLGSTYIDALLNRDVYLITTLTTFFALLLIVAQLAVDLLIVRVDTRVKLA